MDINFWKDKKVFITGHSGFKGSWLCEWFVMAGVSHVGYSLPNDVRDAIDLHKSVEYYEPDIIIHMAAQSLVKPGYDRPASTFSTNAGGTMKVFDACRYYGKAKVILVVTSDKVCTPDTDPYTASKRCASFIAESYRKSYDMPIAEARAGNVIGSGDWNEYRLIPDIVKAIKAKTPVILRHPNSIRPWQHVLDCLNGYLTLIEKLYDNPSLFPHGYWNFGPSDLTDFTVLDVVKEFECEWKVEEGTFAERAVLKIDPSKAAEILNWSPKLSIPQAVRWTKEGYLEKLSTPRKQIEDWMKL